jgi:hypothetical protein
MKLTIRLNVLIASIVTVLAILGALLIKFKGNITGFFWIGSIIPTSPYLDAARAIIIPVQAGYDGQMFLSLAFDPLMQNPGTIAALDSPVYRYRRIFYPLLGYGLGLGNPRLIPYALVAINALCISSLVGMIGWGLRQTREPRWHPLLVLCIPGIWMTLLHSTADLLSSTLIVLAICCFRYGRRWATGIAIALGCLTRETLFLGWLSLMICAVFDRDWQQVKILVLALLPVAVWNLNVLTKFSNYTSVGAGINWTKPMADILQKLDTVFQGGLTIRNNELIVFGTLLTAFIAAYYLFFSTLRQEKPINSIQPSADNRVVWIYGGLISALFMFSSKDVLVYYLGYGRVFIDIFFMLLLVLQPAVRWIKVLPFLLGGVVSWNYIRIAFFN